MESVLVLIVHSSDEDSTKNLIATLEDAVKEIKSGTDNASVTTHYGNYTFDILYDTKNYVPHSKIVGLYYEESCNTV